MGLRRNNRPALERRHWEDSLLTAIGVAETAVVLFCLEILRLGLPLRDLLHQLSGSAATFYLVVGVLGVLIWAGDLTGLLLERKSAARYLSEAGSPKPRRPVSVMRLGLHLIPGLPTARRVLYSLTWLSINTAYLTFLLLWDVAVVLLSIPLRLSAGFSRWYGHATDNRLLDLL